MLVCIWIDITFLPQPNFVFLYMLDLFFSIPLHLKIVYKNCVMCIHFSMISVILSFSAHSWLFYGATHSHNGQFPNQRNMLDRGFRQSSLISKTHTLYIRNTLVGNNIPIPRPREVWSKQIQESRIFFLQCVPKTVYVNYIKMDHAWDPARPLTKHITL